MARRLFGTDGVRGRAGEFLSAELALKLGRAAVTRAQVDRGDGERPGPEDARRERPGPEDARPQVLIVRDTRESGEMLEAALAAGVLPTPASPLLLRRHGFALAAVISASHNPYEDNGIKLFAADGFKLDDEAEHQVEADLDRPPAHHGAIGGVRRFHGALEDYLGELQRRFSQLDLTGRRVVLDCANGATFRAAPEIFRRLGAEVVALADQPDGRNINAGCGSTHLENLIGAMASGDHDLGFAFDGDGDRVLAVDRVGAAVDGDELIALAARYLKSRGRLPGEGVVVTVMTNYGFHQAMAAAGIEVASTPVGDRYVLDELRRRGWSLGGEQSGHIIELGFGPSGDGIASALLALEALGGRGLEERETFVKLPQRLVNIRASDRSALVGALEHPSVRDAVAREEAALRGRGRVLVRASGTEPLIRVMVEAPSQEETEAASARLGRVVQEALAP
jgi:phosphoglucosamine mutase